MKNARWVRFPLSPLCLSARVCGVCVRLFSLRLSLCVCDSCSTTRPVMVVGAIIVIISSVPVGPRDQSAPPSGSRSLPWGPRTSLLPCPALGCCYGAPRPVCTPLQL